MVMVNSLEATQYRPLIALVSHAITTFAAGSPAPQEAPAAIQNISDSPKEMLAVRRHADGAEIGGSFYDRRRSTMNQQAAEEWRRRGLNIAEVAFYSVLVFVIILLSVYVPA
jgi:hypothetical protein